MNCPKCKGINFYKLLFVKHRIVFLCTDCGLVVCENRGLELVSILNRTFRHKKGKKNDTG